MSNLLNQGAEILSQANTALSQANTALNTANTAVPNSLYLGALNTANTALGVKNADLGAAADTGTNSLKSALFTLLCIVSIPGL